MQKRNEPSEEAAQEEETVILSDTNKRHVKILCAAISVAAGIWIATTAPPEGLTPQAMRALGILVWAVVWWVIRIVPEYMTGLMMCALWVATKTVKFTVAFSIFGTGGWWIMVCAFGMGAIATKVGLIKRIALATLKIFPASFAGQIVGLLSSGFLVSPLIPSMTAKGALATPLAMAIGDTLGAGRLTKPAAGLFAATYTGYNLLGHGFLSGSFSHYALIAMLPAEFQNVSWTDWFVWCLPWLAIIFIGMALCLIFFWSPKDKLTLPAGYAAEQLKKLGPMTRNEKIVAAVLCSALLMWMTERLHGIESSVVAITAVSALIAVGLMTTQDFKNGIDWPGVVLIGCVLNMAPVIRALKVDDYIAKVLAPQISSLVSNNFLLLMVFILTIYVLRYIIINMTSLTAMLLLVLVPTVVPLGIHPWIFIFVGYAASNVFTIPYTSTQYMCAQSATSWQMAKHSQVFPASIIYMILMMIATAVSIPYWKWFGLLK